MSTAAPARPTRRPPSADAVASALHTAVGSLVRRLRQLPNESGLTTPEAATLARIDRQGPASASDLARLEQISPQSMGTTLAALEEKGCIARTPDPSDGRRSLIALTPQGRTSLRHRRDERTAVLARAVGAELTPTERADLLRLVSLLERVAEHL